MELYEKWFISANSSYKSALGKNDEDIKYEELCYYLQQAVEKALKGLIIFYGEQHENTHIINKLLKAIRKYTEIPDFINKSEILTDYALNTRYPGDFEPITKEEYKETVQITKECLDWVFDKMNSIDINKQ
jgi:HEPN domain-containing protein